MKDSNILLIVAAGLIVAVFLYYYSSDKEGFRTINTVDPYCLATAYDFAGCGSNSPQYNPCNYNRYGMPNKSTPLDRAKFAMLQEPTYSGIPEGLPPTSSF